jgi:hypothetical protein
MSETSAADDDSEAVPDQIEEAESQRYLEHQDPETERDRAGLGGENGAPVEPLPDERRDER